MGIRNKRHVAELSSQSRPVRLEDIGAQLEVRRHPSAELTRLHSPGLAAFNSHVGVTDGLAIGEPLDVATLSAFEALTFDPLRPLGALGPLTLDALDLLALEALRPFSPLDALTF